MSFYAAGWFSKGSRGVPKQYTPHKVSTKTTTVVEIVDFGMLGSFVCLSLGLSVGLVGFVFPSMALIVFAVLGFCVTVAFDIWHSNA